MIPVERLNEIATSDFRPDQRATQPESRDMARELVKARETVAELLESLADQSAELVRLREAAAARGLIARAKRWMFGERPPAPNEDDR